MERDGLEFKLFPRLQHLLFQNVLLNLAEQMVDCQVIQNFPFAPKLCYA